ncbi:MAG: cyclopropane-fatty-acyl-phospholipid synthase [Opitutaceae bacterium]|nr:cyclopropane-fatty-acyl-phospholipid synthase [Opitutaceae bacterium]
MTAQPPHSPSSSASLSRRLVVDMFSRMDRGSLTIDLPDGSQLKFGQSAHEEFPKLPQGLSAKAHMRVSDERFFRRCVLAGDIGFGESFVDGDWDTPDLASVVAWFLFNIDNAPTLSGSARRLAHGWVMNLMRFSNRIGHLLRPNSEATAKRNIREHYDVSNDFFQKLLDPSMMYSSAIWDSDNDTLALAQERKNESLCNLLKLSSSDHVLEIGTGWGGWSIYAASNYGCHVTTLTISQEQFDLAKQRIADAGLADLVDVQLVDFRKWQGTYDKVVSIEMMEALGHQYLPDFCQFTSRVLKPEGLVALQFITCPDSRYKQFRRGVDFIQKHIFPGSLLLSLNRVNEQLSHAGGFMLNDVSDYGPHYAKTLNAWSRNLNDQRAEIEKLGFDEPFFRRWSYYFHYCEAAFAMRNISVVQTLHTRPNNLSLSK